MKRLLLVTSGQGVQFQCRLFLLVQALIFGALAVLLVALMRSLCLLPGGLGRFITCSVGANHCRLRHIGWEKCGHGLTSRPRESASLHFLDELLALFRYPSGSGRALLAGTLPLRYCSTRFACMTPSWRLPVHGSVGDLVAAYSDAGHRAAYDEVDRDVYWVGGFWFR